MITTLIDIFNIQFASKEQTLSYQSSSFHKFWLTKTNFKKWLNVCLRIISGNQNNILVSIIIKSRILSRTSTEQSGKNEKKKFYLMGFKFTSRTCFESKNFLPKSCPELSNQVLSFSEGQIY